MSTTVFLIESALIRETLGVSWKMIRETSHPFVTDALDQGSNSAQLTIGRRRKIFCPDRRSFAASSASFAFPLRMTFARTM